MTDAGTESTTEREAASTASGQPFLRRHQSTVVTVLAALFAVSGVIAATQDPDVPSNEFEEFDFDQEFEENFEFEDPGEFEFEDPDDPIEDDFFDEQPSDPFEDSFEDSFEDLPPEIREQIEEQQRQLREQFEEDFGEGFDLDQ